MISEKDKSLDNLFNDEEKSNTRPWQSPSFDADQSSDPDLKKLRPPSAEELGQIRQTAQQEGHAQGYQQGLEQAQQEFKQLQLQVNQIMEQFAEPIKQQEDLITDQLAELTQLIAKKIIQRELQQDPEQIIAVIRDAIKLLPVSRRTVMLQLHPEDASIIRRVYSVNSEKSSSWMIADDPSVTRGGCIISTDTSRIDATIEKRLSDLFNHVFGDLRELSTEQQDTSKDQSRDQNLTAPKDTPGE